MWPAFIGKNVRLKNYCLKSLLILSYQNPKGWPQALSLSIPKEPNLKNRATHILIAETPKPALLATDGRRNNDKKRYGQNYCTSQ
jgi:hypothetical protein